ncbi:inositol-tetrakisphosphate 1-kinase [Syncephalis pseudoplumigaleata]|uniref:inositol-1,3,4-trisphosphate 5/6-kinase n=1 Tax=Syncephalis pseudoplumigaleata TaxID=1712513 RepID=A0A4P9YX02_9FUNG|nr:inositol-tetrakisphosphate 1-kinase [Syncephalis pseudoplumigaleata]|eukprot:RKP24022.1 inositol-tetrakisphosphate 1-kinase [Syncephalis pseudoplumigaleata]
MADALPDTFAGLLIKDPTLVQQFIDHDGIIFKVYVADDWMSIEARPSMANAQSLPLPQNMYSFDSQRIPTRFCPMSTSTAIGGGGNDGTTYLGVQPHLDETIWQEKLRAIDRDRIRRIASVIGGALSISLFGFDVIVDAKHGHDYYVVDVNYFPSK